MYIYIWYFSRTMKYKHTIFSSVLPDPRPVEASKGCLEWHVVQKKVPWGLVLLLGGGFAMGEASDASGLSTWMGDQLQAFDVLPKGAIVFIMSLLTAMLTEVTSNTAAASILMPVLRELVSSHIDIFVIR